MNKRVILLILIGLVVVYLLLLVIGHNERGHNETEKDVIVQEDTGPSVDGKPVEKQRTENVSIDKIDEDGIAQAIRKFQLENMGNSSLSKQQVEQAILYVDRSDIDPMDLNQILNILVIQESKPRDLYRLLLKIYRDSSYSDRSRDYAVQFFYEAYIFANQEGRKSIDRSLSSIAQQGVGKPRGTAMRTWSRLINNGYRNDRKQLEEVVSVTLEDMSLSPVIRIAALLVISEANLRNLRKHVLRALDGELDPGGQLKRVAISVLGSVGLHDDLEILAPYTTHENMLIRNAANSAIKTLKKSHGHRLE